jgi:predicted DNA-binding transcriptional regulator AlpA
MDDQNLSHETALSKPPLVLITTREARRRAGNIGRTQEYKRIKEDPDWPRPVWNGGIRAYVEAEIEAYLEKLIARRDAENGANHFPDPAL